MLLMNCISYTFEILIHQHRNQKIKNSLINLKSKIMITKILFHEHIFKVSGLAKITSTLYEIIFFKYRFSKKI